ncbi:MAG: phosphoglucosamine mutase [Thermoanaerobaculales bacterium]|jgi:phosphoglucosamine mutase|nr:phosphoglucosamine mutase [Thermoanaerobaculales bacterium]
MTERLFGTDGIRGRALEWPLDEATVGRLGAALAEELRAAGRRPEILLAGDTRASTETLASWFATAFRGAGGVVTWGGVLPTPAVSQLLRGGDRAAGVVISASHNPADDNGIKVLGPGGEKIDDEVERRLERLVDTVEPAVSAALPAVDHGLAERYLTTLVESHERPEPLRGLHVVLDCANGAGSAIGPELLARLGARVTVIAARPDGLNINRGCGATSPQRLVGRVLAEGADAGLALDGDADRAILVDERGRVLDGDDILLAWARHLRKRRRLPGDRVVATVMSNFGLERFLAADGMRVTRCAVGDRAVWLAMAADGIALGGEQSGHVICSHHSVTGDGLLTGSHVLAIAADLERPVSELSDLVRMPQLLLNVPVAERRPFDEMPRVARELAEVEARLEGRGRVLLRYSGTEPLARVMVEGEDAGEIQELAGRLTDAVRADLGQP